MHKNPWEEDCFEPVSQQIVASPEVFDKLLEMIDQEVKPDPRLVELFARPRRIQR